MIGYISIQPEVKVVRYDPFEANMQTFAWSEISNQSETPIMSGFLL